MNVVRGHEEDTASMKACISSTEADFALGQQSVCKNEVCISPLFETIFLSFLPKC